MKSRSFSIYLLKEDYNAGNALKDNHQLRANIPADALPANSTLLILDADPRPPWWRSYFQIDADLFQVHKGALLFLPVGNRTFVLSFGQVSSNLKDASYEYDFGLRVTLNAVDPKALRSTDAVEPVAGRRQRTQLPVASDLTLFDFDRDSSILRRLTGKVRAEHRELIRQVTGSSNLRVNSALPPDQLPQLCEQLLALYLSDDYRTTFPDLQNITPVRDPVVVAQLNEKLVAAVRARDDRVNLVVPDLINYDDAVYAKFGGEGVGLSYDDVYMDAYYDYLANKEIPIAGLTLADLKKHYLFLTNEDGESRSEDFSILKSLMFDTHLGGEADIFHLNEGNWYKVDGEYANQLRDFLDPLCVDVALPNFEHDSEGAYNADVARQDPSLVCLDRTDISPNGQTQVEPCDLYKAQGGTATFYHVKISTLSATLSHLFNQGTNSIELIRVEPRSMTALEQLISDAVPEHSREQMLQPLRGGRYQVIFVIITHKDRNQRSSNLPLFSRISLRRNLKALQAMNVAGNYAFVEDTVEAKAGIKIKRKRKKVAAGEAAPA